MEAKLTELREKDNNGPGSVSSAAVEFLAVEFLAISLLTLKTWDVHVYCLKLVRFCRFKYFPGQQLFETFL